MSKLTAFLFCFVFGASPLLAGSSKASALMGQSIWNAFTCSAIAFHTGDHDKHERLLLRGLVQGEEFLLAYQANKIYPSDFKGTVPAPVAESLDGPAPTIEFVMGRIYEKANRKALEIDGDLRILQAKFLEFGCDALVR
jgi:hypothetical protein